MDRSYKLIFVGLVGALSLMGCEKQRTALPSEAAGKTNQSTASQGPKVEKKTHDGPMGIAMGILPSELTEEMGFTTTDGYVYQGTAPKPVEGASTTLTIATEKAGVCRVIATFDVTQVNETGDQIRQLVDRLHDALASKYGNSFKKTEYFAQDVYRRNSQFWMMGLAEDSISYAYTLDSTKSVPLPYNLEYIEVAARATSTRRGYAAITYSFTNMEMCKKEKQAIKAQNL